MLIEVIHSRDPDTSCDIHVYVDGVAVASFTEIDIDPGAGYTREGWNEHRKDSLAALTSPMAIARAAVLFDCAAESQYIEDV